MKTLTYFIAGMALWVFSSASAHENTMWLRSAEDCIGLVSQEAKGICSRIMESRKILETIHPKLVEDGKGGVTAREVFLVAWDTKPHLIQLRITFRPKDASTLRGMVLTPGYEVQHVAGTGPYKLQFRVLKDGIELPVYGGKHVWIPHSHAKVTSARELKRVIEERQYLPFQPHLYHPELVKRGQRFLEEFIDQARTELNDVPSQAFPGLTLPQVSPREMLLSLIVSEHTDPYKLFDERVKVQVPREYYLLGTLVEIALHGPHAFAELCSRAPACGWTQFTNIVKLKPNKKTGIMEVVWPGTYNYTRENCRTRRGETVLLPDFQEGTRDAKNAVKAAICYLDLETSALPKEARDEYRKNVKVGGVLPMGSFNAGGFWSNQVWANMKTFKAKFPTPFADHASVPQALFERGKFYNQETHWYIKKYLWVLKLLYEDQQLTVPVPHQK